MRPKALRVAVLSDYQPAGGAAIAASRLLLGLSAGGDQVTHPTGRVDTEEMGWPVYHVGLLYRHRLLRAILIRCNAGLGQSFYERMTERRLVLLLRGLHPDGINVHNLHGARRRRLPAGLAGKRHTNRTLPRTIARPLMRCHTWTI